MTKTKASVLVQNVPRSLQMPIHVSVSVQAEESFIFCSLGTEGKNNSFFTVFASSRHCFRRQPGRGPWVIL